MLQVQFQLLAAAFDGLFADAVDAKLAASDVSATRELQDKAEKRCQPPNIGKMRN